MKSMYFRIIITEVIKGLFQDFRADTKFTIKVVLIVLGLIALFVIAASAASPVFAAFDRATGYLP
jgi:hypothetical protein